MNRNITFNISGKIKVSRGNIVAIVSVVATALASCYGSYMQHLDNKVQQEKILELEKYKQVSQLEVIDAKAKIERFNAHCIKIEQAIKNTSRLLIAKSLSDDPSDRYVQRIQMISYIYLLPKDKANVVMKISEESENLEENIHSALQIEYRSCIHSEF